MKIERHSILTDDVLDEVKIGLKKSNQLTSGVLNAIEDYAKEWIFLKGSKGQTLAFGAIKKSVREGYEAEIGFLYEYPEARNKGIQEIVKFITKNISGKIYAEVLLSNIKNVFKRLGYKKLEEWDSQVRSGKKVFLYTNDDSGFIKKKETNEGIKMKKNLWNIFESKIKEISEDTIDVKLNPDGGQNPAEGSFPNQVQLVLQHGENRTTEDNAVVNPKYIDIEKTKLLNSKGMENVIIVNNPKAFFQSIKQAVFNIVSGKISGEKLKNINSINDIIIDPIDLNAPYFIVDKIIELEIRDNLKGEGIEIGSTPQRRIQSEKMMAKIKKAGV